MFKGIDVSDNQGLINWQKVKNAGCEFSVLRTVRGSGKTDYQFERNVNGCQENDIPFMGYKYMYGDTEAKAKLEAAQVVNACLRLGIRPRIFQDVEDRKALAKLGKEQLTKNIKAALEIYEQAGFDYGIYVGWYVFREKWFDFSQFTCPMWVARYYWENRKLPFGKEVSQHPKPEIDRPIWGWQYTSSGQIDGLNGSVDLNLAYFPLDDKEDPTSIYVVSAADVATKEDAEHVAKWIPDSVGRVIHKIRVNGVEIWTVSVADVWSRKEAEMMVEYLNNRFPTIHFVIHEAEVLV